MQIKAPAACGGARLELGAQEAVGGHAPGDDQVADARLVRQRPPGRRRTRSSRWSSATRWNDAAMSARTCACAQPPRHQHACGRGGSSGPGSQACNNQTGAATDKPPWQSFGQSFGSQPLYVRAKRHPKRQFPSPGSLRAGMAASDVVSLGRQGGHAAVPGFGRACCKRIRSTAHPKRVTTAPAGSRRWAARAPLPGWPGARRF